MSAMYVLLPLALVVGAGFVAAFVWALRQGQFDDLDGPPVRMLFGDKEPAAKAPKAPADTHEHS